MRRPAGVLLLVFGAVGCADPADPAVLDGVTMITYVDDGGPSMAALGRGTLVVQEGCLAMAGSAGPPSFVLWPSSFGLERGERGIEVIDGEGNLVAGVGEPVELGGGWTSLDHAQSTTDRGVPGPCRTTEHERYFLASPSVGWELDGVTLLRHRSEHLAAGPQVAEGRLGDRNGCVALLDEDGDGPYVVLPRFHHLIGGPNFFQLVTPQYEVIAEWGARIRVAGSAGSIADPHSLPGGIPGSCQEDGAAYWYVGDVSPA